MATSTSWGRAAKWYEKLLGEEGTYQRDVILPNLLRVLDIKKGEKMVDVGCGPGFFACEFFRLGARVIGADVSKAMIDVAREHSPKEILYYISPSHDLSFVSSGSADKITIVLALQNIDRFAETLLECNRILKPDGGLFVVLNHPAFRVPKESSWGWDPSTPLPRQDSGRVGTIAKGVQYRRIDAYLSEAKVKIQMHPGDAPDDFTLSFHRPMQVYMKGFRKAGFLIETMEEWISNKKSQPGPRARAEDRARKEIPLFLLLVAVKKCKVEISKLKMMPISSSILDKVGTM